MPTDDQNPQYSGPKIIVGLGNPGRKYVETRHNVGFKVIEELRQRWFLSAGSEKFHSLYWQANPSRFDEEPRKVVLVAPMTYMNESGRAVRAVLDFFKAPPSQMLVVFDDFALDLGLLRIRTKGSAGGHNGLSDIIRKCGTNEIQRLRIGIGQCPGVMQTHDFVLSKFRPDEIEEIGVSIKLAADAVEEWIFKDIHDVMQKYNRKNEL